MIIGISDIDRTDNLTCEIIYNNFTCENYQALFKQPIIIAYGCFVLLEKTVYVINRKNT